MKGYHKMSIKLTLLLKVYIYTLELTKGTIPSVLPIFYIKGKIENPDLNSLFSATTKFALQKQ